MNRAATRIFNSYVLVGWETDVFLPNTLMPDVADKHSLFTPARRILRDRSKYMPHQGARECARRRSRCST